MPAVKTRDVHAYRRKLELKKRVAKSEAIERSKQVTTCYTEYNPPQIASAFEMISCGLHG